ncbi:spore coat protein GerQ [Cytobacillus praedii]|uniref:spore coat protein GerQ n=1 Tax=Cytobacillus praedii TaxID=1742358 RepID=UPI002E2426C2|nr:spore coat protein GerQ [Cytobacillus praedii]MED3571187.1 spore coat protein GerQ [Cytobacillus praedii]
MSQNFNQYQYTANPYYGYQQPYTGGTSNTPAYRVQPPMAYPQMQTVPFQTTGGASAPSQAPQVPGMLPIEQSYIENILRLNKGKLVTVYATFENNREWNAKKFEGIIEAAGRDHVILSDPQSGMRYLIPMVYVDYVTFEEEIEYDYPSFGGAPSLSQYSPR